MATDPVGPAPASRTECVLHEDARIIAGVSAVISNAAERASLSERAQKEMVNAVLETCRKMFAALRDPKAPDQMLRVASMNFPDRVEVSIETSGKISSPGAVDEIRKAVAALRMDRAECEIIEGRLRVTLAGYADAAAPNPQP